MGKDIFVGNNKGEIIFQDIFKTIRNNDRIILSETEPFHTLIDGLNVPKSGFLEITGGDNQNVKISAGMSVYGELTLRNLTLDFSLTDERAGERIYVEGGRLNLYNVTIVGSNRSGSPVMINDGILEANDAYIVKKAGKSYAVELKNKSKGIIHRSKIDGYVITNSEIFLDNTKVRHGAFIKEQSTMVSDKVNYNFYHASDPRNLYVTDSKIVINQGDITGDKIDNPLRLFNSKLEMRNSKIVNLRTNGFGLEFNSSTATIENSEIRGIFSKDSKVNTAGRLTLHSFFELYENSVIKAEELNIIIAPPNFAMQLKENSSAEVQVLTSPYSPLIKVDNSSLNIETSKTAAELITAEVSGNYTVEGDNINVKELNVQTFENKQLHDQNQDSKPELEKGEALKKLFNLTGLNEVKSSVKKFINLARVNQTKKENGLPVRQSSLHSVYLGNPGTGKTTVARLVGQVLYEEGVLKNSNFVEVSRQDLVSGYLGKTTEQTLEKLKAAHGGVFFLDEAYTLNAEGGTTNYGQEALDTILKYMEDNRDEIMVIFAGYTKEMYDFFTMNQGLKSRIPHYFDFEDYSAEELAEIGIKELEHEHFQFDHQKYSKELKKMYRRSSDNSNARFVRNFNEKLILEQSNRVAESTADSEDFLKITDEDWTNMLGADENSDGGLKALYTELNQLTGLDNVKSFISGLIKEAQANKMFEERGMEIGNSSYHMMFTGPPGTGKTTIARLIAKFFKQLDIIPEDKVIEVDRSDLVGSYIGHTEKNTKNVIERAMGGVLFIDEAYQLSMENSPNDFGKQAIETLITELENKRDKFIVIFAGYTEDMLRFMHSNEGLKSRVPYTIEFPAYTAENVADIVFNMLQGQWRFNEDFLRMTVISEYDQLEDSEKSNGRWARNFTQKLLMRHKSYIVNEDVEPDNFDFITDKVIFSLGENE